MNAIRTENFDGFLPWLEASAGVAVPRTMRVWVQDHFTQPAMWDLLQKLSIPVGLFQGETDANTPAAQVRALEQKAKAAGKTNLEFRYFDGLDHGLGTMEVLQHRQAVRGLRGHVRVHEALRAEVVPIIAAGRGSVQNVT